MPTLRLATFNVENLFARYRKTNTAFLFSRDCLEVDVLVGGKPLTLYINHFKSMMGDAMKPVHGA